MNFTRTVVINKPLERAWHFVIEPNNLKYWAVGFQHYEPLTPTIREPGSKAKHHYKSGFVPISIIEETIDIHPYKKFHVRQHYNRTLTDVLIVFSSLTNSSCQVDITYSTKFKNALEKGVHLLFYPYYSWFMSLIAKKLKRLVEAE